MADCKNSKTEIERPVNRNECGRTEGEHNEGRLGREWGSSEKGGRGRVGEEEEGLDVDQYGCTACHCDTGSADGTVCCRMDGEPSGRSAILNTHASADDDSVFAYTVQQESGTVAKNDCAAAAIAAESPNSVRWTRACPGQRAGECNRFRIRHTGTWEQQWTDVSRFASEQQEFRNWSFATAVDSVI